MVFIVPPSHKTLSLDVDPKTTSLHALKLAVQQISDTPISHQRLFLSQSLRLLGDYDSVLISDLGIRPYSTLTLHVPFLGGTQPPVPPKPRFDFLNSKPPPNYVAGLGRGATGFTTRSDIGPARAAPDLPDRSASTIGGAAPAAGRGGGRGGEDEEDDEGDDKGYDENQKFDEFEGNDVGLFASAEYDEDDKEADAVWEAIDKRMDSRRKDRREARLKQEIEKYRASNPKITEQFADLKRKLYTISAQEWDSIPEIGDYSLRNKKKKFESFVPVPDTLLEKARQEQEHVTALDPKSRAAGGTETPWAQTPVTDLTAVGEGRGTVLSLKLDRLSDSVSGLTVVDPKGYLTDLKSMKITSDAEISDIKKARLLLKSVTQTNPKHPPGWIAAARLEEVAGKIQAARQLIQRGCEECPKNEDVWLEACRLANPEDAKAVIAKGVKSIPNSVKLWMQAAKLEHDDVNKSRALRKGLEHIPDSVRLWKAVVELANEEDARLLLHRAVECCPLHVELWLALARLETYDNARKVLNRARERLPKEPAIWITAAKLEEANGNTSMVGKIIERGIRALQREGLTIDREAWMKEAEAAERAGSVATCQAIIRNTIAIGVEEEDRKRTWVADAEECKKRGSIETARAIYAHALTVFLTKKSIWLKAAQLEKSHGTRESLDALLRKAVTYRPQAEVLWLMGAKEKWLAGDVPAARAILQEAYAAIPNSEEIWLAAFKLEFENHEPERARMLLAKARERGGTERVWMKSAIVERELGNIDEERRLLDEGLNLFPSFFKLWLMLGQLEERLAQASKQHEKHEEHLEHLKEAKKIYESGLKNCPNCIPLWLSLAKLEEEMNGLSKARAVLTMARKKNPQNPELWLAAVRAELKHGNKKEADILMAKALQECPNSGILWAMSIEMVPRPQRKSKSMDALKKCDHDPHVIAAVAKLFWHDRKVDKARTWLNRAVTLAPDIGDFWAWNYKFELQHGAEENQKEVLKRCVAAEPKHGEKWQSISKAVENSHHPTEAILKKVVVLLGKEENAAENEATAALTKRYADGSLPIEDFNVEVEDQSGQKCSEVLRLIRVMMGLMLHANGNLLIRQKNYNDALVVLSVGELSEARKRLEMARIEIDHAHIKDFQCLRLLQGGFYLELAL
ncbi:protein STABILIZED1-like isoform X2 [Prosopis cineraria]|uniref:protein STABILIZED1-like isoform X2 n=1 Tax=Prosopis cineraria TaxID=364024 RepID=UPI00240F7AD5|nr:protein STABILIZED1-like isoform X2 [Prosopis cineraria]